MRQFVIALAATAALGTFSLSAPASAAPAQTAPVDQIAAALQTGDVKADYVQYYYRRDYRTRPYAYRTVRPNRYGYARPYYGNRYGYARPYYGRRYGYYPRGYYYRRDRGGDALAAGAIGLATGAIIGGALAQQQRAPVSRNASYCAQRYRSYDPASGTYLGYDGRRHSCP